MASAFKVGDRIEIPTVFCGNVKAVVTAIGEVSRTFASRYDAAMGLGMFDTFDAITYRVTSRGNRYYPCGKVETVRLEGFRATVRS